MRKKAKYYQGTKITPEVIRKMDLIKLIRQKEGITTFNIDDIETIEQLCDKYYVEPENINIILGEDRYILYTTYSSEIEIQEWIAINNVKDKLIQTMEMFNSIKDILLEHQKKTMYATLRYSTSYKFYKLLLNKEYIDEIDDSFLISDDISEDLLSLIENRDERYHSIEEYLDNEPEEKLEHLPDFIYHDVVFKVTKKFTKRYPKDRR